MANQNKNQRTDGKDISKKSAAPNKSSLDNAEMQRDQSSQSQKATQRGDESSSKPMNQPVNNPAGELNDDDEEELEDEDMVEDDAKVTGRHPSQRDRDLK
ncbi:MAG TPA: hypothetical protein VGM90_35080 [Kofleriaceae bacterium]|jgi:hypothetical protein